MSVLTKPVVIVRILKRNRETYRCPLPETASPAGDTVVLGKNDRLLFHRNEYDSYHEYKQKDMKRWKAMAQSLVWAALGTGFAFVMTVSGAATVFLFKEKICEGLQKVFLGFASGIMIAASVWSLIIPSIEQAESMGRLSWIPSAVGFLLGGLFLLVVDWIISDYIEKNHHGQLLVFAVTLHNIPEGMAVGLAFALAAQHTDQPEFYAAAFALAVGIGVQNFPEGAAVALPLRQEGMPACKAFMWGVVSAAVEPVFGMLVVLVSRWIRPVMPWLLSFAAGAMIYVVVEELVPEANEAGYSRRGTLGCLAGFLIMMILDVALSV